MEISYSENGPDGGDGGVTCSPTEGVELRQRDVPSIETNVGTVVAESGPDSLNPESVTTSTRSSDHIPTPVLILSSMKTTNHFSESLRDEGSHDNSAFQSLNTNSTSLPSGLPSTEHISLMGPLPEEAVLVDGNEQDASDSDTAVVMDSGFAFPLAHPLPPPLPAFPLVLNSRNRDQGPDYTILGSMRRRLPVDLNLLVVCPDTCPEVAVSAQVCEALPMDEVPPLPNLDSLPVAKFRDIGGDASFMPFRRPCHYIKHSGQSYEDLNNVVDYDMDSSDEGWVEDFNRQRRLAGMSALDEDSFELVMDRLEKEAFRVDSVEQNLALMQQLAIDESDDVCCVCYDGMSDDCNQIVYCDGCDVAVHQDCYGIKLIPAGSWRCRRCVLPPLERGKARCFLCPDKGGAMVGTTDGRWVHVVCAVWLPEAMMIFRSGPGGSSYLDKVDVSAIPEGRYRLQCSICKIREGACVQCAERVCTTAFHVTCARRHGLKVLPVGGQQPPESSDGEVDVDSLVHKIYCEKHGGRSRKKRKGHLDMTSALPHVDVTIYRCHCGRTFESRHQKAGHCSGCPIFKRLREHLRRREERALKRRRRKDHKKHSSSTTSAGEDDVSSAESSVAELLSSLPHPNLSPQVARRPTEFFEGIQNALKQGKRVVEFLGVKLRRMQSEITGVSSSVVEGVFPYWIQKRLNRKNVPLLRRFEPSILMSSHPIHVHGARDVENKAESFSVLKNLRRDLEVARSLLELVKRREKCKREFIESKEELVRAVVLDSLNCRLWSLLDRISSHDRFKFFSHIPRVLLKADGSEETDNPRDISDMYKLVEANRFNTWQHFSETFELMMKVLISNSDVKTLFCREAKYLLRYGKDTIRRTMDKQYVTPPVQGSQTRASRKKGPKPRPANKPVSASVPRGRPAGRVTRPSSQPTGVRDLRTRARAGERAVLLSPGLLRLWEQLSCLDTKQIFALPVTEKMAPGYHYYVHRPMDLQTMKRKVMSGEYPSIETFESDFELMCRNCLLWNPPGSAFHEEGRLMLEKGNNIISQYRDELNVGVMLERQEQLKPEPRVKRCVVHIEHIRPELSTKRLRLQGRPSPSAIVVVATRHGVKSERNARASYARKRLNTQPSAPLRFAWRSLEQDQAVSPSVSSRRNPRVPNIEDEKGFSIRKGKSVLAAEMPPVSKAALPNLKQGRLFVRVQNPKLQSPTSESNLVESLSSDIDELNPRKGRARSWRGNEDAFLLCFCGQRFPDSSSFDSHIGVCSSLGAAGNVVAEAIV